MFLLTFDYLLGYLQHSFYLLATLLHLFPYTFLVFPINENSNKIYKQTEFKRLNLFFMFCIYTNALRVVDFGDIRKTCFPMAVGTTYI